MSSSSSEAKKKIFSDSPEPKEDTLEAAEVAEEAEEFAEETEEDDRATAADEENRAELSSRQQNDSQELKLWQ